MPHPIDTYTPLDGETASRLSGEELLQAGWYGHGFRDRVNMIRRGETHADVMAMWTSPEAVARFEAAMAPKAAASKRAA